MLIKLQTIRKIAQCWIRQLDHFVRRRVPPEDEIRIRDLQYRPGHVDMSIECNTAMLLLTKNIEDFFEQNAGENYITMTFYSKKKNEFLELTVRRVDGLTPAEKLTQMQKRIDELEKQVGHTSA